MAKLNVLGDVVQIKSDLTTEEIERVCMFEDETLKLRNEEGEEIFAIGLGHASVSKYGIVFCSTDAEGKAYVTTGNTVEDHSNPEAEKAALIREWAPIIAKLNFLEAQIALKLEKIIAMEDDIAKAIIIN